jgi:hypothetical protein
MMLQSLSGVATNIFTFDLFRTLIAAAFGTFAGAWISSRAQRKREIVSQINNIVAAMELSVSFCNQFMGFKRQITRPLKKRFSEAKEKFEKDVAQHRQTGTTVSVQADLQMIPEFNLPTKALEQWTLEKISIRGRSLGAAVELLAAIDALQAVIQARNELLDEFRRAPGGIPANFPFIYFGLRLPSGQSGIVDARNSNNIDGLETYTDHCIFYSKLLSDDLLKRANKLIRRHKWRYRLGFKEIQSPIWTRAVAEKLIPPDEQFADWLGGFVEVPTKLARFKKWISTQLRLSFLE